MKKIFISGKITGEQIQDCVWKFQVAVTESYNLGNYEPSNPLFFEGITFGISHKKAMEICLAELKDCDAIFMLKDWKQSKGAKIEHQFAKENNIKIYYQCNQRAESKPIA